MSTTRILMTTKKARLNSKRRRTTGMGSKDASQTFHRGVTSVIYIGRWPAKARMMESMHMNAAQPLERSLSVVRAPRRLRTSQSPSSPKTVVQKPTPLTLFIENANLKVARDCPKFSGRSSPQSQSVIPPLNLDLASLQVRRSESLPLVDLSPNSPSVLHVSEDLLPLCSML